MRTCRAVWSALVIGMFTAGAVHAQALRYLGPDPATPTGWVELAPGQVLQVKVGDEIPAWGVVAQITEMYIALERRLSDAEQEQLRSQGKVVYQVLELRIPRADLGAQLPEPQ